jgi:hypothetical protein
VTAQGKRLAEAMVKRESLDYLESKVKEGKRGRERELYCSLGGHVGEAILGAMREAMHVT